MPTFEEQFAEQFGRLKSMAPNELVGIAARAMDISVNDVNRTICANYARVKPAADHADLMTLYKILVQIFEEQGVKNPALMAGCVVLVIYVTKVSLDKLCGYS